jgi:hypothetical protein
MKTVNEIINAFGGAKELAALLGMNHPTTIQYWQKMGHIPEWRQDSILNLAAREGVKLARTDFPNRANGQVSKDVVNG